MNLNGQVDSQDVAPLVVALRSHDEYRETWGVPGRASPAMQTATETWILTISHSSRIYCAVTDYKTHPKIARVPTGPAPVGAVARSPPRCGLGHERVNFQRFA